MPRFVRRARWILLALGLAFAATFAVRYVRARQAIDEAIEDVNRRLADVGVLPRAPLVGDGLTPGDGALEYEGLLAEPDTELSTDVTRRILAIARVPIRTSGSTNPAKLVLAAGRARRLAQRLANACRSASTPRESVLPYAVASLVVTRDWALQGIELVSDHTGNGPATLAICAIGWALDHGAYDASTLEAVGPVLEALASAPSPRRGIELGGAAVIAKIAGWEAPPEEGRIRGGTMPLGRWPPLEAGVRSFWSDTIAVGEAIRTLRSLTGELADAWAAPSARLNAVLRTTIGWLRPDGDPFEWDGRREFFVTGGDRLAEASQLALVRTALAWARWVEARGAVPPSLEALVPRYLTRVPTDPMTGKVVLSDSGRVWCVGADGDDDRGSIARPYGDWGGWLDWDDGTRTFDGDPVRRLAAPPRAATVDEHGMQRIAGRYAAFGSLRSPPHQFRNTVDWRDQGTWLCRFVSIDLDGEVRIAKRADFDDARTAGRIARGPDDRSTEDDPTQRWILVRDAYRIGLRHPDGEETWLEPIPPPASAAPK